MNLFLNTTFFEHTLTKTQDFLSFLVFRIGGPLCMLLYDALKFGRMLMNRWMVWYAAKSVEMTPSMRYAKKFAFGKIQQWGIIGDK